MFAKDNGFRDKIIYDVVKSYETKSLSKENWTWLDVSISVGKVSGFVVTPNACRKAYKRYCDKQISIPNQKVFGDMPSGIQVVSGQEYLATIDKLNEKHIDKSIKIEKRDDGSVVSDKKGIENIEEGTLLSDEDVLKLHKLDPLKWKVKSHTDNWYESNGGKDFGIIKLCQSKLIVEPKNSDKLTLEDISKAIDEINSNKINRHHELIKVKQNGKAFMVDVADLHVGSLSWHEQVGQDNDYKIAFGNLKSVVSQIANVLKEGKYEELVLDFLGDFLHVDTSGLTTSGGTQVDTDSRPEKMIMKAYEMVMFIIDNLAMLPTKVKWVGGNHSKLVEFAIFQSLPKIYANVKHIEFDVSPMDRKVWTYGVNLVGLLHGDEISKEEKTVWLQRDFKAEWSNSKYAEIHCGHFHQEQLFKEVGGITHRTNPTLKIQDKYEYDHGWSSTKVILGYSWDKVKGLEQVYYFK